jgi:hypothetical protein
MKSFTVPLLAIVTAAVMVGMVTVGIQQHASAFGFVERQQIGEFKKLTHELEKAVIGLIGNPNDLPPSPVVRELLQTYAEDVSRIFLGGPDTIPELVGDYQQKVLSLLVAPPDPEKHSGIHSGIDFMQDLHILTHEFEKAVINAVTDRED